MKIVTFNVNRINGRLSVLLRWLEEARPGVVCLEESKAPDGRFPIREIGSASRRRAAATSFQSFRISNSAARRV